MKRETKELMAPTGVLLDFEEALAKGFTNIFPGTTPFGDFFHFIQANLNHAGQLGLKLITKDIDQRLRELWHASTKEEFDVLAKDYVNYLYRHAPNYANYFRKNWLERYPPEKWASFGRPSDAPAGTLALFAYICTNLIFLMRTGSGAAEGIHNRWEEMMPKTPMAIDQLVDWLAEEDKYWERTVNDPQLWEKRKATTLKRQERYQKKRTTLKNMTTRDNPASEYISFNSDDMLLDDDNDADDYYGNEINSEDVVHRMYEDTEDEDATDRHTPVTASSNLNAFRRNSAISTINLADRCLKCKNRKTNAECDNHVCKQCCIKMPGHCKVACHKRSKPFAKQGYVSSVPHNNDEDDTTTTVATASDTIVAKIDAAMQQKPRPASLFISYSAGTRGASPRKITPLRWVTGKGGKFDALCYFVQPPNQKTFYACKVTRAEDDDWDLLPSSPAALSGMIENYVP